MRPIRRLRSRGQSAMEWAMGVSIVVAFLGVSILAIEVGFPAKLRELIDLVSK